MLEKSDGIYPPSDEFQQNALISEAKYDELYAQSINDPETFWGDAARERLDWIKPFTRVKNTRFDHGSVSIKWFEDGSLNVAYNCVDRHLETRGDQTAIIFEPDDPEEPAQHITYKQLHAEVCKMAGILEHLGVRKGHRVVLYLPM
ncbi:MAG: acetyl-coenzyme A synthetase N-terminal domain-containing protein, partial [Mangrovicoccus sp.]